MQGKMIILILLFSITLTLFASQVPQPRDVKPSADIYEDVMRVLEAGIMSLDEEGYFNGSLFVTRYELAESFSSLLKLAPLEKMKEVVEKVKKMDELFKRIENVEKRLSEISLKDIFSRIERTKMEMNAQLEKMESSLEMVKGYNTFVDAVKGSLKVQEEKLEDMKLRVANNEKNLSSLTEELNSLSKDVRKLSEEIDPIKRRMDKVMEDIENQKNLADKISNLEDRIEDVELKIQEAITASKGAVTKVKDISEFSVKLRKFEEDYEKIKKIVITTNESVITVANDVKGLKERNDEMRKEIDRLRGEVNNLRNNIWYAMGAGIVGASLGLLALVMLWQKGGI